jgi:hypothetical protein
MESTEIVGAFVTIFILEEGMYNIARRADEKEAEGKEGNKNEGMCKRQTRGNNTYRRRERNQRRGIAVENRKKK